MTGNFEVVAPASSPVELRADAVDLSDAAMDDIRTIRPGARSPLTAGVAAMIWGLGLSTYPAIWLRRLPEFRTIGCRHAIESTPSSRQPGR